MRWLAFISFVALQLSVFTCGFAIHVHAAGMDEGHIAEHIHHDGVHDDVSAHEQPSHDHGCHPHASHSFTLNNTKPVASMRPASMLHHFILAELYLKKLYTFIDNPPKPLHS